MIYFLSFVFINSSTIVIKIPNSENQRLITYRFENIDFDVTRYKNFHEIKKGVIEMLKTNKDEFLTNNMPVINPDKSELIELVKNNVLCYLDVNVGKSIKNADLDANVSKNIKNAECEDDVICSYGPITSWDFELGSKCKPSNLIGFLKKGVVIRFGKNEKFKLVVNNEGINYKKCISFLNWKDFHSMDFFKGISDDKKEEYLIEKLSEYTTSLENYLNSDNCYYINDTFLWLENITRDDKNPIRLLYKLYKDKSADGIIVAKLEENFIDEFKSKVSGNKTLDSAAAENKNGDKVKKISFSSDINTNKVNIKREKGVRIGNKKLEQPCVRCCNLL